MTDVPPQYPSYPGDQPPPAGNNPPPPPAGNYGPPPAGNYPPPPPAYGQQQQPGMGTIPFASWWSRVGAVILDGLIAAAVVVIPVIAGAVIAFQNAETREVIDPATGMATVEVAGGVNPVGVVLLVLSLFLYIGFTIWNQAIRQGKKGQSLGKKVVGIKVVKNADGQVLGAGSGFLRWLMSYLLGNLCFINYLWPLWDNQKQTWHDKVVSSVVLKA